MKLSRAFTLVELLVVLTIIVMIIGIFTNRGMPAREAGRRQACMENLRQITKAVRKYESEHGPLAAVVVDKDDKTLYSWRVAVLPYLDKECRETYKEIRLAEPWDSEHNRTIKCPTIFRCKSLCDDNEFYASYVLVTDRMQNKDGSPYPVVAEILPGVSWMQPVDLSREDIEKGPRRLPYADPTPRFASNHPGLAMLGMSDGSVEMVQEQVPEKANEDSEANSNDKNDDE